MTQKKWETYEQVAVYLLNKISDKLELEKVECKQKIQGDTGVEWEIDGKGLKNDGKGIIVIECRRYTSSKQSQAKLGRLAYTIKDTGASGGIIVSPLGLQKGAKIIAEAENIVNIKMDKNSTEKSYLLKFLNKIMLGLHDKVKISASLESIKWEKVDD